MTSPTPPSVTSSGMPPGTPPGPRRRRPLRDRLLHPARSRESALLATDHRLRGEPLPISRRSALELEQEARDRLPAERRVARAARRAGRVAGAGERRAHRARDLFAACLDSDAEVVVVRGRAITLGALRHLVDGLHARLDGDRGSRRLDRSSRGLRFVGVGLLVIDVAALIVIFGYLLNLDWLRPDLAGLVTVVALSLFGGAVQAVLAVHLGRRLSAWRHTDPAESGDGRMDGDDDEEFPPRSAVIVVLGGALVVVSAFAAGALYLRVQLEGALVDAGPLSSALGLLLGASALAAPWCVVAAEAFGPGPAARTAEAGGRVLRAADRRRRARLRRARGLLRAAQRRVNRLERMRATTRHGVGRDYQRGQRIVLLGRGLSGTSTPCAAADLAGQVGVLAMLPVLGPADHTCLDLPVEHLRAAVEAAREAERAAVRPVQPADLDLAG